MKKWLLGLLAILVATISALYIFIPGKLEISKTAYINVAPDAVHRNMTDESKWRYWWPAKSLAQTTNDTSQFGSFVYNKTIYTVTYKSTNIIEINLAHRNLKLNSHILIIPLKIDSTAVRWKCMLETGLNPFNKIKRYQQAKQIKKNMDDIFNSLQAFLGKQENIYNLLIRQTTVTDTILVATKLNTIHYPTTTEVYTLIYSLQKFISSQGAKETNHPMLHVLKIDSNRFETMIAIPVDKKIKSNGNFAFKRMVPGKILVAQVRGGINTIEKGMAEMENYLKDYHLQPPAIPFESLVTNRMMVADTAQWITKLYYPIL